MNEIVNANNIITPVFTEDDFNIKQYSKIPLNDIADLGIGFQPIVDAIKQTVKPSETNNNLYQVFIPEGGHLASFKDGNGYLGAVLNDETNKLMGQARIFKAPPVENAISFNPALILVAVSLKSIDMKLNVIKENTNKLIYMLDAKTDAEIIGNYKFLLNTLNEYKFNWDNELYKKNSHNRVLDLKRQSLQQIEYIRNRINKSIYKKGKRLHDDKYVDKRVNEIVKLFTNYQVSLYMFYMANYLNILLIDNYNEDYLQSVINELDNYSYDYRKLYSKAYSVLENESIESVPNMGVRMLSKTMKTIGVTFEKIPVVNKGKIDEKMKKYGNATKSSYIRHRQKSFNSLRKKHDSLVVPFKDNIQRLNMINNHPVIMLYDDKNIYYKGQEA